MSSWSIIRIVAEREVTMRIRSRAFAIVTVLVCAGIVLIGVINRVAGDSDTPTYDVAVIGSAPAGFAQAVWSTADAAGVSVTLSAQASRAAAEAAVRDESIDAAVDASTGEVVWATSADATLSAVIDTSWGLASSVAAATGAGLDDDELAAIFAPRPLQQTVLSPDDEVEATGQLVGLISAVLLFFSITFFGGYILMGVVEEKSSAVVEVLLSHVRPHQLLIGKVFGTALVAFVQFGAAVASGLVALNIADVEVPRAVWVALPSSLLWMIGGFLLYSTLFAVAGSLVSRQEDAQAASLPITIVVSIAYVLLFPIGSEPDSTVAQVMSMVPPFAPLLMPLRIATGSASAIEVVVAVVLLAAATYGMLRFAGAIYGRTLLHRGTRLTWRQALRPTPD
jgi:ABC-2 type transport system permease protein